MSNGHEKRKELYGEDYLQKLGAKGGSRKVVKGFAALKLSDPEKFKQFYINRKKRAKK